MNRVKFKKTYNSVLPPQEKIEIINYQKIKSINVKNIRNVTGKILYELSVPKAVLSIVLCDNKFIKKVNKRFFRSNYATDVISFPLKGKDLPNYLGEIIISVEQAEKVSVFYSNTWREELTLYLIHGAMHLLGHKDIKRKEFMAMQKKQELILKKIIKTSKRIIDKI